MKAVRNFITFLFIFMLAIPLSACGRHVHVFADWEAISSVSCSTDEVWQRECIHCDYKQTKVEKTAFGHNFSEEVTEPTETSAGYTAHTCWCGYSYNSDYTYLITYKSVNENLQTVSGLPQIDDEIYLENQAFEGVENVVGYKVLEYRIYNSSTTFTNLNIGQSFENSTEVTIVWEEIDVELIERQNALNELLEKIKKLEEISKQYGPSDSVKDQQLRVLQYIRQKRYSSGSWNTICGTLPEDFSAFVDANEGVYDLSTLQSISYIEVPLTGEKLDFVHMVATMNAILKQYSLSLLGITPEKANDLAGWGGDLCQLTDDLVGSGLTGQALIDKARELFNGNSGFGQQDLVADLDAINIMSVYNGLSTKSLTEAMKKYYEVSNEEYRKEQFVNKVFSNYKTDVSTLSAHILSRLSSNTLITTWCSSSSTNKISFTTHAEQFNASIQVFSEYLLSI